MNIPAELKYTQDHEWVRVEGNTAIIGVTDFAQGELGDIVYVEINDKNATINAGEVFGTVEAVKTTSELFAPISGKIIAFNETLNKNPETVNTDAYGEGWIIKVEISNPEEINGLLDSEAYKKLIGA